MSQRQDLTSEKGLAYRLDLFSMSHPAFTTLLVETFLEAISKIGTHNFLCRKTRIIFTFLFKIIFKYALNLFARTTALPGQLLRIPVKWLFQK